MLILSNDGKTGHTTTFSLDNTSPTVNVGGLSLQLPAGYSSSGFPSSIAKDSQIQFTVTGTPPCSGGVRVTGNGGLSTSTLQVEDWETKAPGVNGITAASAASDRYTIPLTNSGQQNINAILYTDHQDPSYGWSLEGFTGGNISPGQTVNIVMRQTKSAAAGAVNPIMLIVDGYEQNSSPYWVNSSSGLQLVQLNGGASPLGSYIAGVLAAQSKMTNMLNTFQYSSDTVCHRQCYSLPTLY